MVRTLLPNSVLEIHASNVAACIQTQQRTARRGHLPKRVPAHQTRRERVQQAHVQLGLVQMLPDEELNATTESRSVTQTESHWQTDKMHLPVQTKPHFVKCEEIGQLPLLGPLEHLVLPTLLAPRSRVKHRQQRPECPDNQVSLLKREADEHQKQKLCVGMR